MTIKYVLLVMRADNDGEGGILALITPAISVLSAVEGLKVVEPSFDQWVVPITAVIIALLFASQRVGTAKVGSLLGPVMIVWFLAIGACGVAGIAEHPEILKALRRPMRRVSWSATSRWRSSRWPGMARWRKRLFVATSQIPADAAVHFGLPRERTVIIGSRIEV